MIKEEWLWLVKNDYNEETKVRCATPIDYAKPCGELAEMIQGY